MNTMRLILSMLVRNSLMIPERFKLSRNVVASIGLALAAILTFPMTASAGLVTVPFVTGPPPPNDCSGVFGQGFENCVVNESSIIAKYNIDDEEEPPITPQLNIIDFPSIDGSEFSFDTTSSGNWSYLQGTNDPSVRYWVAKGGNLGFNLFYVVPDANDAACLGDGLSEACLDLALAQSSGTYAVPNGGLSHLSFYNGGGTSVPEPASLVLLGLGLAGLGVARRRRH